MRSRKVQYSGPSTRSSSPLRAAMGTALALIGTIALLLATQPASAIGTAVPLGTAASYSVLGGQSVTNTGPSILGGDVGVSPGTSITGFPPGTVLGTTHSADAQALQAQSDLTIAYNNAAGQAPDSSIAGDLGGLDPRAGGLQRVQLDRAHRHAHPRRRGRSRRGLRLPGRLDADHRERSTVALLNDAQACNVFWQIGSSATLGHQYHFRRHDHGVDLDLGEHRCHRRRRALARNGSVTLDTNVFTSSACETAPPTDNPSDNPTVTPPDDDGPPPGDDDGNPPGDDDGTPPGDNNGNPPGGGNGNPPGGGDGTSPDGTGTGSGGDGVPDTLAVTG